MTKHIKNLQLKHCEFLSVVESTTNLLTVAIFIDFGTQGPIQTYEVEGFTSIEGYFTLNKIMQGEYIVPMNRINVLDIEDQIEKYYKQPQFDEAREEAMPGFNISL